MNIVESAEFPKHRDALRNVEIDLLKVKTRALAIFALEANDRTAAPTHPPDARADACVDAIYRRAAETVPVLILKYLRDGTRRRLEDFSSLGDEEDKAILQELGTYPSLALSRVKFAAALEAAADYLNNHNHLLPLFHAELEQAHAEGQLSRTRSEAEWVARNLCNDIWPNTLTY